MVGFFSPTDNTLKKVSILGGPAVTVCELPSVMWGASWGQDDTIIFATGSGLSRVSADGGEAEVLTTAESPSFHAWPDILPGGRAALFGTWTSPAESDQQIVVLDLETSEQKVLIQRGAYPRYSPSGHIVYALEGALHAIAFDLERLDVTGDPVPVLARVGP